MILRPYNIRVIIWPDTGWRIQWALEKKDVPVGVYSISIERSSAQEGPWTTVESGISLDDATYVDSSIKSFRAHWQYLWYKIKIINGDDDSVFFESSAISVFDKADKIASEIIRQHELLLYGTNGHPGFYARDFACFKRTKFGTKCNYCMDPYTDERFNPKCNICKGTGYLEGFANPITFRARFVSSPRQEHNISTGGEDEQDIRTLFMAAYPICETGDVLAQKNSGNRWRVESVDSSMPGDILVSQRITVSRIKTESIYNSLNYPS